MSQRIYDRIRELLETTPGLTQKGLAHHMGLNPAAINRMLHGNRHIMAEEIPVIEDYLGVRLSLSAPANVEYKQDAAPRGRRGLSDVPAQRLAPEPQMVPVYSYADGTRLSSATVVDWALRHPAQFGIVNAFAIYASSTAMEPRYYQGELVYLHPGRVTEVNRDCVVELKSGEVLLGRCLQQAPDKIRIAQFNPAQEKDIPRREIQALYPVIGRG